jgi:hypothetical protein
VLKGLMKIADLPKFAFDVALFHALLKPPSVFAVASPVFNASKIVSAASMPLFIAR